MKRICDWCGKDMGDKPPYEDYDSTHGICEECYKKWRKGHKMPDCELLPACPFFNFSIYDLAETYKGQYCKGDYRWCGRYMAFKAGERIGEGKICPSKKQYSG